LEVVQGLSNARQRVGEIAASRPGRYFIYSLGSKTVIAQIETFAQNQTGKSDE
jgi:hypothetical protein